MDGKRNRIVKIAVAWVLTVSIAVVSTFLITKSVYEKTGNSLLEGCKESSYRIAVEDSVNAEQDEILPLVTITKDSPMVTWSDDGQKVLMLSWNDCPESYPDANTFKCGHEEVWTFTDREMLSWYQSLESEVQDWDLRFKQLLGLPEETAYTHFTAFWVDSDEIIRPAYQPDVTQQVTEKDLDGSALGDYKEWFDGNILWSYFYSDYPWTRLGYTYDWAGEDDEYGLSEFIILPNSTVEVEWTVTTEEFVQMLKSGSLLK